MMPINLEKESGEFIQLHGVLDIPSRTRSRYVVKIMAWEPRRRLGLGRSTTIVGLGFDIGCHAWRWREWLEWMIA